GKPRRFRSGLQIVHPETQIDSEDETPAAGIRVRYPEIEGLGARLLERICQKVCERFVDHVPDGIPEAIGRRLKLASQSQALRGLHLPDATLPTAQISALN